MAVPAETLADDFAIQNIERGKQGRGAVAHIVMGPCAAAAGLERQTGLGAIECLNLALLIDTEHDRLVRRIEIDAHHVGELFDKAFVPRKLERPLLMRLEAVQVPDPLHRLETKAFGPGHRAATPLRLTWRRSMLRGLHHRGDLLPAQLRLASSARRDRG